ncbi:MAG: hypothetical protein ABI439_07715 [Rhodospirillales bacterium]
MSISLFARLYQTFSGAARTTLSRRAFFHTAAAGAAIAAIPVLLSREALAAPQPLMQRALDSLRSAKTQLQNATADKGGHRAKAIQYINSAIAEVEAGIRFDNTH